MGLQHSKQYDLLEENSIELGELTYEKKSSYLASELLFECQKLIVNGQPLEAFALIENNSFFAFQLYLPLHAQEFIELTAKKNFFEAMIFAQKFLAKHKNSSFVLNEQTNPIQISISNLMGLLCYENPENSVLKDLLDPSWRYSFASLAESVMSPSRKNRKICEYLNCCKRKKS